ncbi:MAG: hypothetical protein HW418_2484, partial [Anaerolineales bacterium]|nr:hypothetical protein [Anaerolineales bacterium]
GEIRPLTLVVGGERDLPDIHRTAEALQQGIPKAQKAILRGAGHMANMEAPQKFNEVVLSFLAAI